MHSPVLHQNELLQRSNSGSKPPECSIFTAVAEMSSRWVEPLWESYWLQKKLLPDKLWRITQLFQPCHMPWGAEGSEFLQTTGKLFPLPQDSGPTPNSETQKVNYSWSGLMQDKPTWDFHGYQSRLHLLCCVFCILVFSQQCSKIYSEGLKTSPFKITWCQTNYYFLFPQWEDELRFHSSLLLTSHISFLAGTVLKMV